MSVVIEIDKPSVRQKDLFLSFMEEGRHLDRMEGPSIWGMGGGAHGSWLGHKDDLPQRGFAHFL